MNRDCPFLTLDRKRVIGWREKDDSFPSGHTTQIFFLMTLFIHHFQLGMAETAVLYAVAAFACTALLMEVPPSGGGKHSPAGGCGLGGIVVV
jgi:hypothetical protein